MDPNDKELKGFTIALTEDNFKTSAYGALIGILRSLGMAGLAMAAALPEGDPRKVTLTNQVAELNALGDQMAERVPPGTAEQFTPKPPSEMTEPDKDKLRKLAAAVDDDEDEAEEEVAPWDLEDPETKH